MQYKPISCTWELSKSCKTNSYKSDIKNNGLTTEQAINLCEDIVKLGVKKVTLLGYETYLRNDWNIISKSLKDSNVIPSLITNEYLINKDFIKEAEVSGIDTISINLETLPTKESIEAFDLLNQSTINSKVITSVNNENINILENIKEILIKYNVNCWKFKIEFNKDNHLTIAPETINKIIDFSHKTTDEGLIKVELSDCIGYFNSKEQFIRTFYSENKTYSWTGCDAGIHSFCILYNGDILGCISMKNTNYVEGNIKEKSLIELWNDETSFSWRRTLTKEKLKGKCSKCIYGDLCKGGCTNARLKINGNIYSENNYCSYNIALTRIENNLKLIESTSDLIYKADYFIKNKNLPLAELTLSLATYKDKNNINILNKLAFINYELHNYKLCKELNEQILTIDPHNCYATKGLGLALVKLDEIDKGLEFLYKSLDLITYDYLAPYYDLTITLLNLNKKDEALHLLNSNINKYPKLKQIKDKFFN